MKITQTFVLLCLYKVFACFVENVDQLIMFVIMEPPLVLFPKHYSILQLFILQIEQCRCTGWKNSNAPPQPSRTDITQPLAAVSDPCRNCSHTLGYFLAFSFSPILYRF